MIMKNNKKINNIDDLVLFIKKAFTDTKKENPLWLRVIAAKIMWYSFCVLVVNDLCGLNMTIIASMIMFWRNQYRFLPKFMGDIIRGDIFELFGETMLTYSIIFLILLQVGLIKKRDLEEQKITL